MTIDDRRAGLYIGGQWREGDSTLTVYDKFSVQLLQTMAEATDQDVDECV